MELGELVVLSIGNAGVDIAGHLCIVPRVPDGKAELDRVRGIIPVTREACHRPPGALVHPLVAVAVAVAVTMAISMAIPMAFAAAVAMATLLVAVLGDLREPAWGADPADGVGERSWEARQKGVKKDGLGLHRWVLSCWFGLSRKDDEVWGLVVCGQ